ncbi:hypothetical protein diail_11399 [Diaporthe ilicicola]|nr:hypothetical protein diail_11399 [Diaporthe ilicicola]
MAHSFHIPLSKAHLKWNNAIPPVLTVPSGAEITFDLMDGGNNQIRPDNESSCLSTFDFAIVDPAFGPVYVEGAEPGDVLKVEIQSLTTADYGWTAIFSGFGLLLDDFPEQHVKVWDLSGKSLLPGTTGASGPPRAVFKPGISVPVRPFLGVLGIAPAAPGDFSTIPPYALSGGNVDTRYLGVGSTVYFPVQVPGALFSCGDAHAAQGDGEVCGTAIETPAKAGLRLSIIKKGADGWMELSCPHYITPPRTGEVAEDDLKGTYAALGIHADPREAARMALRGLIDWLEKEKGLTRVEGYMLASVAASLRMTEVVDMPNFAVSCSIPLSTFE